MGEQRRSYCRICAAACGIVVEVEGDRVVGVAGDPDHPVSRGYTCPKGRALGAFHHSPARLDRPRLRGVEVSWTEVLDDLRSSLVPATTGFYLATGFGFDAAAQISSMTWFAGLGSPQLYTAVTVDNAPVLTAAELVTGQPMLNPVWDPEAPGLLLAFGINPVVSHGYGTAMADPVTKLRRYRSLGGQVWVLDPRRSHTAAQADEWLSVRPGSDTAVLAWLCRELLDERPDLAPADVATLRAALDRFTLDVARDAAGVDVAPVLDAVRANVGRLAVMCGTGLTMSRDGVLAEWLRWVLLAVTGSLDVETGMRFNRGRIMRLARNMHPVAKPGPPTRPELRSVIGQYPCVAMVDEIEAGNLRSLVVGGGNPLSAFPDRERTRAALASLDVLAVVDVVTSELTELATHVLPAAGQLERADLTMAEHVSIRSGIAYTPPVVPPAFDRKPVWWIFSALAGTPLDVTDEQYVGRVAGPEVVAAGPHGVDVPHEYGWVARDLLPDGVWRIAPAELVERLAAHVPPSSDSLVLVNRRDVRRLNSLTYAGDSEPVVRLNPADAPGSDRVTVTTAHGSITATVVVDEHLRPGTASVNHGRPGADVACLTSATEDVDPLTGMPLASGVPVTVTPA